MNKITINGTTYQSGKSISIKNNEVIIDGEKVDETTAEKLVIKGEVNNLQTDLNVNCDNVSGDIIANGNVNCDDVSGNISAKGNINCDNVKGSIQANGNVNSL